MLHRVLVALRRRLALDGNPMRRRMDRYEIWLGALTVLVLLVAAPGVGAKSADARRAAQQAENQASHAYRVTAVINQDQARTYPGDMTGPQTTRDARWTAPDGTPRHGAVSVPYGSSHQRKVTIWTDAHGNLQPRPRTPAQIDANASLFGAFAGIGVVLCGMVIVWAGHRLLDRRRLAAWDTQWTHIAPRWTRQY